MAIEDEVQQASDRFYEALNRLVTGDSGAMMAVWSHGPDVTTMHPLGGREVGWEQVRTTLEQAGAAFSDGRVTVSDQVVVPLSGEVAYTVGIERGEGTIGDETVQFEHRVTNIYRREAGAWKMVHHHTDLSPTMVEMIGRVMAQ